MPRIHVIVHLPQAVEQLRRGHGKCFQHVQQTAAGILAKMPPCPAASLRDVLRHRAEREAVRAPDEQEGNGNPRPVALLPRARIQQRDRRDADRQQQHRRKFGKNRQRQADSEKDGASQTSLSPATACTRTGPSRFPRRSPYPSWPRPACASTAGVLVNTKTGASPPQSPSSCGPTATPRCRPAGRTAESRDAPASAPCRIRGALFSTALPSCQRSGTLLRARAIQIRTGGHRQPRQRRMECAVIVAAQIQILHAAGDIGRLVRSLRDAAVGGGDSRHADGGQQQKNQSGFGRQHAMIQGNASTIRTSSPSPQGTPERCGDSNVAHARGDCPAAPDAFRAARCRCGNRARSGTDTTTARRATRPSSRTAAAGSSRCSSTSRQVTVSKLRAGERQREDRPAYPPLCDHFRQRCGPQIQADRTHLGRQHTAPQHLALAAARVQHGVRIEFRQHPAQGAGKIAR